MDQNLIIPENNPEDMNMLLGGELYLIEESRWYTEIPMEGGNKYRFLNIVSHNSDEIIPKLQRDFFFRMVNAIQTDRFKMDADGFAVINVFNYKGLKWKNIEHLFSPKYCIFWGVDPAKMDLPCKLNGGAILNDSRIIYVDAMEAIYNDEVRKRSLWELVQRMFGIKRKS